MMRPFLRVRVREGVEGEPVRVVEVLDRNGIVGVLPAARVVYEISPSSRSTVVITLHAEHAEIETMDHAQSPVT